MTKIDNYQYRKLDYQKYQEELDKICKDPQLLSLGLSKHTMAKSEYGYNIDLITIGYGQKDLFIVGGTHGSEIISVDFILQLIKSLPTLDGFDPNLLKLHIIPIQNPEGFNISTNTLKEVKEEMLKEKSYEYYLKYRLDHIISSALLSLNNFFNKHKNLSSQALLLEFRNFINNDSYWKKLSDNRAIPNICILNKYINDDNKLYKIDTTNEFKMYILNICNKTLSYLNENNIIDNNLYLFIDKLKHYFSKDNLLDNISPSKDAKLHQQMFENITFQGLYNLKLEFDLSNMFETYNHPKGSQITYDATGDGINLNANTPLNPRIEELEKIPRYEFYPKNNINASVPGPIGIPTRNSTNFTQSIENEVLESLINTSYQNNTYLATLLYHGTGGIIFYKPHRDLMNENDYYSFLSFNENIANIYKEQTQYQLIEKSDKTGFGDYLRKTYPGVLLIELSKMGGNPIGPYGDENNIYRTIHDNIIALNKLFYYFQKENIKKRSK